MGIDYLKPLSNRLTVMKLAVIACAIGTTFTSPAALADDDNDQNSTTWALGLAVIDDKEPYIGMDDETSPFPLLHIENRYLRIFGQTIEAKLPGLRFNETNALNFSLMAKWNRSGYDPDDSSMMEGMEKREGGFWAGAKVEWQTSLANINLDWTHDIEGYSEGQRVNLSLDRTWRLGNSFRLTPRIGTTWYDSNYTDYYYGVRADEARADRPEYHGESAFSMEIGLQGMYRFKKHHSLVFDLRATKLPSEAEDSPLVEGSTFNRIVIGYMYYF